MAGRSSYRPTRHGSAQPNQESPDRPREQSSSRFHDEYDDARDPLHELQWQQLQLIMHLQHRLQAQSQPGIRPPGMQVAPGSMPMWYLPPQNVHPTPTSMSQVNHGYWMDQNNGPDPSLHLASANFGHPPYHHHQPAREPVPNYLQLLREPPQHNNSPEQTAGSNQRHVSYPPQVFQPMFSHSTPGRYPSMTNGTVIQQPNHFDPSNHKSQQEAQPSTQPGPAMEQTDYCPPNHSNQLPTPPFSYQPSNIGNTSTANQPTRSTGRQPC